MHIVEIMKKSFGIRDEGEYIETPASGIVMSENITVKGSTDNVYRYLINGFLIFCSTYGSLTCFISAFSIECYKGILFFILLVLGMLYAFMHISKKIRKIGYAVVFVSYIYMVIKLRVVIKSGFSRMVNVTLEYIEEVYVLPIIKRYSEYVDDSRMSVTVCLIVIGFVMSLLLNIIISEFMSVSGVLAVTFPIAQLGMYFDLMPDYFSYFLFILSPIVVLCIKLSGRYCISENEAVFRYSSKNGRNQLRYSCDPGSGAQAAGMIIICVAAVMLIISPLVINSNYGTDNTIKSIKKSTNVYVRNFAIAGFSSFFNNSSGAGGISGGGELGNVNVVRLDYKTDLEVTFVPIDGERFFLKAFTGSIYADNKWDDLNSKYGSSNTIAQEIDEYWDISNLNMVNLTSSFLAWDYNNMNDKSIYKTKLSIKNIDANCNYAYLPYYSYVNEEYCHVFSDDNIYMDLYNTKYDIDYYVDVDDVKDYSGMDYKQSVENYIDENKSVDTKIEENTNSSIDMLLYDYLARKVYMDVPENNKNSIVKFCAEYGINENDKDVVQKVADVLENNYTYSLKCGKTPEKEDFINYFLTRKKEGYCAHFASAAVLIYRYLGMPARYVEGYVIDPWDYDKLENANISDYISGENTSDMKVVKAEVNDSQAHAWVEVYKAGFGWIPVDVTPSSDDDTSSFSGGSFLSSILALFGGSTSEQETQDTEKTYSTFDRIKSNRPQLIIALVGIVSLTIMVWMIRNIVIKNKRDKGILSADNNHNVIMLMDYFCQLMSFVKINRVKGDTLEEYAEKNKDIYIYEERDSISKIINIAETAQYSEKQILKEEYDYVYKTVFNVRRRIIEKSSFWSKVRFFMIEVL